MADLEPTVATPADPQPADPTRVLLRRCVAYLIDVTLVVGAMVVVLVVTGDVKKVPNCDTIPKGRACFGYQDQAILVNQRALVWFFLTAVVMVVFIIGIPQATLGTSAGKGIMGIRLVRKDGSHPGAWRSFARLIAWDRRIGTADPARAVDGPPHTRPSSDRRLPRGHVRRAA